MKICEDIWILKIIFERQGPEKGPFLFLLSLYITVYSTHRTGPLNRDPFEMIVSFSLCIALFPHLSPSHPQGEAGDLGLPGPSGERVSSEIHPYYPTSKSKYIAIFTLTLFL